MMYPHTQERVSAVMQVDMACGAKGDQIFFAIVPGSAAKLFVVNLKTGHCATRLASPPVTTQHLVAELFVQFGIQPQARLLRSDLIHDPFPFTWCRNVCLSSPGRNLKNRKADSRGIEFSESLGLVVL
jgi:hypothetical protein